MPVANVVVRTMLRVLSIAIIMSSTAVFALADDPVVPGGDGCGRPYCADVLYQNPNCTLTSGPLCPNAGTCYISLGGDCQSYVVFRKLD